MLTKLASSFLTVLCCYVVALVDVPNITLPTPVSSCTKAQQRSETNKK